MNTPDPAPVHLLSGRRSRSNRILRLARKELRESLRDRRTLVTLIFMPVLVYPLLGIVIQRFSMSGFDPSAPASVVLLDQTISRSDAELLLREIPEPEQTPEQTTAGAEPTGNDPSATALNPDVLQQTLLKQIQPDRPRIRIDENRFPPELLRSAVREGYADAAVILEPRTAPSLDSPTFRIVTRESDRIGNAVADELTRRITLNRDQSLRNLLRRIRIGPEPVPYIEQSRIPAAGPPESPLSAFVPLMLLLMTMTGAVYPSIDLTAGERERGTLEMLLAAPVCRRDLLLAKFFTVLVVAVLTAIVNLIAMVLTLIASGFDQVVFGGGIALLTILQLLLLLVVFAAFFSAVLLSITTLARSFREAQAWLIPLMLISLAPGVLSLLPGIRLTIPLAVTPLINIVLLARDLLQGRAGFPVFLLTLSSTAVWAVAAVNIAAGIFDRDLLATARVSRHAAGNPDAAALQNSLPTIVIWKCLAVLIPFFVVLPGLRGRLVSPENITGQLLLSAGILILTLAVIPAFFIRRSKADLRTCFALNSTRLSSLLAGLLMGLGAWTLVYEVLIFNSDLRLWQQLLENSELQNTLERLMNTASLPVKLLCLAAVPAVCEELFFRGFLFSSLRSAWNSPLRALAFTSLLFAAAHVVTDASLTLERFPGTLMLGLLLGLVRIQSGSILPGIVLHAANNAFLLSLPQISPFLEKLGISLQLEGQSHLPPALLAISVPLVFIGWILLSASRKQRRATDESPQT